MKQHSKNGALPGTQAVTRAFSVLRVLASATHGQSISELATATQLNKASVFRALSALESEGMVSQPVPGGAYSLGTGLIALGNAALSSIDIRGIAREELVFLTQITGETATLEVPIGSEVLILDELQGRYLLGSTPELGRRWPIHATSTGKLFLALSESVSIPSHLEKCAARTITNRRDLEAELARIRRTGFSVAVDELEPGFVAIAAPVRNHTGSVIAALSINGPKIRLGSAERRSFVDPLCESAKRVSRRLGAAEPFFDAKAPVRKTNRKRSA